MPLIGLALRAVRLALLGAMTLATVAISAGTGRAVAQPLGVWVDHTGRGAVEITQCGAALCGHIVWLQDAGNRQLCGRQIIGNAQPVGAGRWDKGWIFDPEDNKKYDVELRPSGTDRLVVTGYLGTKLFGETMTWRRPTGPLARCDGGAQQAATPPATAPPPQAPARELEPAPGTVVPPPIVVQPAPPPAAGPPPAAQAPAPPTISAQPNSPAPSAPNPPPAVGPPQTAKAPPAGGAQRPPAKAGQPRADERVAGRPPARRDDDDDDDDDDDNDEDDPKNDRRAGSGPLRKDGKDCSLRVRDMEVRFPCPF